MDDRGSLAILRVNLMVLSLSLSLRLSRAGRGTVRIQLGFYVDNWSGPERGDEEDIDEKKEGLGPSLSHFLRVSFCFCFCVFSHIN